MKPFCGLYAGDLQISGAQRTLNVNALDRQQDRLCPLIKVTNSLDGTSKVSIEIGADAAFSTVAPCECDAEIGDLVR